MSTILDPISSILSLILQILRLLLRIFGILKRYPLFTVMISSIAVLYGVGWWLTYVVPARKIQEFYQRIEEKEDITEAWKLLHKNYQKVWSNDPRRFASGYKTTVAYSDMRIKSQGLAWNPIGFLFFNSLTFNVSFVVEDRFSKKDLQDPVQQVSNTKWLNIAHPTDYSRLEDGTLGFETLSMKRRFQQVMDLKRADWQHWYITNIQNRECSLIVQR